MPDKIVVWIKTQCSTVTPASEHNYLLYTYNTRKAIYIYKIIIRESNKRTDSNVANVTTEEKL